MENKKDTNYDTMSLKEKIVYKRKIKNEYKTKMRPVWMRKGQELRKMREKLKISRQEVSACIGASIIVIIRLENGDAVRRRPVIETSYETALKYIPLHRKELAGII